MNIVIGLALINLAIIVIMLNIIMKEVSGIKDEVMILRGKYERSKGLSDI